MNVAGSAHRRAGNWRAIVAMIVSQAAFTVNDAVMKLAARDLPGGEAIFIRGLFTILFAGALALALGGFRVWPPAQDWPRIVLRCAADIGSTLLYLSALFHMPIADATAILQVLPLAITAGAALVLGEGVGWRRWLATAVGFLGVLVIVRPGTSAFTSWSLVALAAVASIVVRDLTTRRISATVPTGLLTVLSSVTVTAAATGFVAVETWVWPTSGTGVLIGTAAAFLIAGYYFVIEAMRHGEVAVVSPFRYSVIVWAILAGILVFGETPDPVAMLGTGLVMAAGLYTFFRERQLDQQRGRP